MRAAGACDTLKLVHFVAAMLSASGGQSRRNSVACAQKGENKVGYVLTQSGFSELVKSLESQYRIFAPVLKKGAGRHLDTDVVLYDFVKSAEEIELEHKSDYAFKEALLPMSETLFFFTEQQTKEADLDERPVLVFLRSCDLHALKRLDDIYLRNGKEIDPFYKRRRDLLHFVLIGCPHAFENCFCVDMGSNLTKDGYVFSIDSAEEGEDTVYRFEVPDASFNTFFEGAGGTKADVQHTYVTETKTRVRVPEEVPQAVMKDALWDEYTQRCIGCGRCNFVCPTCTCFTMQDVYYTDNGRVGERRRVEASCMVDGFTNVAGGGQYRKTQGERMRFKVLHKISDHKKRFGENMCVGCGRCDDVCPEYISYSHIINKVYDASEKVLQAQNAEGGEENE